LIVDAAEWGILWPHMIAGLLSQPPIVPLACRCSTAGSCSSILAIAQVAALAVLIVATTPAASPTRYPVQIAALSAALLCAMLLTWTDQSLPQVQEAIIGVVSSTRRARRSWCWQKSARSENLKDLLSGQICG